MYNSRMRSLSRAMLLSVLLVLSGCKPSRPAESPASPGPQAGATPGAKAESAAPPAATKTYKIAVIAKSQGNQVFQAARVGAEDAAREIGAKLGINILIDWRTPNEEDAQKQAEYIDQLTVQGVHGITISCSDASTVTNSINKAVDRGVAVMCFDSDAPESKRFCFFGVDDVACGEQVLDELARALGPAGGKVAILAGNQTAPNLQIRAQGVRAAAARYPTISIVDTFYHAETPQDAAAKVEEVQTVHPDIAGWAMIGGWALFADSLLKWEPGKVKIVSVDALPEQLAYVRAGVVQVLLAQRVYDWGYRSVELLVDKIHLQKDPPAVRNISPLVRVTTENVDEFGRNWDKWLRK